MINSFKILLLLLSLILSIKPIEANVLPFDEAAYRHMDDIALQAGTDKSSVFHNYTKVYSQYFKHLKDSPINFLEIGIFKGDSVKLWENYFTQANLNFIDITDKYLLYRSPRSKYFFIDQEDKKKLVKFAKGQPQFDVIIDDGGHMMKQQLNSFEALFPFVKPGGLYIVEDLHTSYWTSFDGSGNVKKAEGGTMVGFLKALADSVNFAGAASYCADYNKLPEHLKKDLNYYREHIEAIHFYSSVCIIEKR